MEHKSPFSNVIASAAIAGFFSGYVINMFEAVKTRTLNRAFVNMDGAGRMNAFNTCKHLIKTEGLSFLLKGSLSQCIAGTIRAPIQMGLYEFSNSLKLTSRSKSH